MCLVFPPKTHGMSADSKMPPVTMRIDLTSGSRYSLGKEIAKFDLGRALFFVNPFMMTGTRGLDHLFPPPRICPEMSANLRSNEEVWSGDQRSFASTP